MQLDPVPQGNSKGNPPPFAPSTAAHRLLPAPSPGRAGRTISSSALCVASSPDPTLGGSQPHTKGAGAPSAYAARQDVALGWLMPRRFSAGLQPAGQGAVPIPIPVAIPVPVLIPIPIPVPVPSLFSLPGPRPPPAPHRGR